MRAVSRITPVEALLLIALAATGLLLGWRAFHFLTDDAYIAFRYVANLMDGHGLVWNPPPFRPVEGYTSLLWVLLLALVWGAFGVEPPAAANVLSAGFGAATLWLGWRIFARLPLPETLASRRALLFAVALVGTLSNRTFLAWLSSGLETAMFSAWVMWFVLEATAPAEERVSGWAWRLCLAAALAALSRPEGAVLAAGAAALIGAEAIERRRARLLLHGWPLLALPLHLGWRLLTYGEWLPNTWYAKYVGPWPESGARYAASFLVEYGLWIWLALALLQLARWAWRRPTPAAPWRARGTAVAVAALASVAAYYTFAIGGDHFEYRIYHHLVPLCWISGVWLAAQLARPVLVYTTLGVWLAVSLPIAWVHWDATRHLATREETRGMFVPIADRLPAALQPLVARWDAWQGWLIRHNVCVRHQEHAVFHRHRIASLPTREEGARMRASDRNVFAAGAVGVVGWVMPHLFIIDLLGLNDHVVARLPPPRRQGRRMAHDRLAPPAYVKCFLPNVEFVFGERPMVVTPRTLTSERVRECEARDWTRRARAE